MGRANSVDLRARVIRVAIRCFEVGASIWCDSASGLRRRCQRGLELERCLRNPMAVPELWDCLLCQQTEEMRGATTLPTYRTAGGEQHKALAVAHLKNALSRWGEVVRVTKTALSRHAADDFHRQQQGDEPGCQFPLAIRSPAGRGRREDCPGCTEVRIGRSQSIEREETLGHKPVWLQTVKDDPGCRRERPG